jgi:hypothetical protein
MATMLEQARTALNNAQPGDVTEAYLTELPDGRLRIEIVLNKAATAKLGNTNQWVQFAEAMHRDSPLRGQSETLCQHSREFRDSWVMDES